MRDIKPKRLKHKIFLFSSEQLDMMLDNELLFVLAKLIELIQLQIIGFLLTANTFPNSQAANFFHTISGLFLLGSTIDTSDTASIRHAFLISFCFLAAILQIFLVCKMSNDLTRQKISYFLRLLLKISSVLVYLFKSILLIPCQLSFLEIFTCTGFSTCFSTDHIIWFSCACLAQLFFFQLLAFDLFFTREGRIDSPLPWSCFPSLVPYIRATMKLMIGIAISL